MINRIQNSFILLFFFSLFSPSGAIANTSDQAAKLISDELTENLNVTPLELEITNLLLEGTPISSPFADEFLDLLMDRLKRNEDDFVRVKRRVVTEKKAQTRGLSLNQNFTSEDETIEDAILSGTYRESGNKIFINIRITGDGGESISNAESSVSISTITLLYKPELAPEITEESHLLNENNHKLRKDFKIDVIPNKGNGAIYYHGDPFEVHLEIERDAYLKMLYRQINGKIIEIFDSQKPVSAGIHTLPHRINDKPEWEINCGQKKDECGVETLVVLASSERFEDFDLRSYKSWELPQILTEFQKRGIRKNSNLSVIHLNITTMD
jgi:hypothetical protein